MIDTKKLLHNLINFNKVIPLILMKLNKTTKISKILRVNRWIWDKIFKINKLISWNYKPKCINSHLKLHNWTLLSKPWIKRWMRKKKNYKKSMINIRTRFPSWFKIILLRLKTLKRKVWILIKLIVNRFRNWKQSMMRLWRLIENSLKKCKILVMSLSINWS